MTTSSSVLDLERKWYMVPLPLRSCSLKDIATSSISKEKMDECFREAQTILDKENAVSQMDRGRWYNSQFLSRGTTADKVASAAVKLSDNDFMFFLDGFNLLFDTARTDTHHYEAALKALAAIWPKLLPPRPLKRFVSQYFATLPAEEDARKRVLVYWYLEDHLKRTYAQFLSLAESMLKDRLVQRREAWLDVVGRLMCAVAEGRNVGMSMMIDKLGDPSAQVGHKAYHHLLKLLSESSMHQSMLFTELEKILFMKNCPLRTMRYAANVMNQLVFNKDERKLALKSVQTYLSLFRQLAIAGNVDSTVTTAIIVGLRRAFPYAGTDIAPLEEHLNALFVMVNTGSFQQRVATLSLLQLLALGKGVKEAFQNRWYRALYQLLLVSPKHMPQSTQLTNFFSMLHRAMRADSNSERVVAFVHRLLQRAVFFNDAMVCSVLLLVGEMTNAHPIVRTLIRSPAKRPTSAEERYMPKGREPQFTHASSECLWSLNILARHSHPSVVKLSVLLLFGEEIVFDVHPLDDMTPLNFLQMFVDAKAQPKGEEKARTGMSVFKRAVHAARIPSASDSYFINSSAQDVDVSALFLHRYAVQRQRFLDGLSQVRSSWGDDSGEMDVAIRVSNLDSALFGPSGALTTEEDRAAAAAAVEEKKATERKRSSNGDFSLKKGRAVENDEDVASEDDLDDGGSDVFDARGSDADLEWGSADEAAYDEVDEETLEDHESDGGNALGGDCHRDEADDGNDFGEVIAAHQREISRKRKREEAWLESRTSGMLRPAYGRGGASGSLKGKGYPKQKRR